MEAPFSLTILNHKERKRRKMFFFQTAKKHHLRSQKKREEFSRKGGRCNNKLISSIQYRLLMMWKVVSISDSQSPYYYILSLYLSLTTSLAKQFVHSQSRWHSCKRTVITLHLGAVCTKCASNPRCQKVLDVK